MLINTSVDPHTEPDRSVKYMSGLINAFKQFTEVINLSQAAELKAVDEKTLLIYASVTRNDYIISKFYSGQASRLVTDLRSELELFVEHRMIGLLTPMVSVIMDSFLSKATYPITDLPDRIELVESEVLNRCRPFLSYRPNKFKDSPIDDMQLSDLYAVLYRLKTLFSKATIKNVAKSARYAYLISEVAIALMIAKHRLDEDYDKDQNELDQDFILEDFSILSNLGSINITNMVCCIHEPRLLRLSVSNSNGVLGYQEKLLLRNGLMMTKMLSLLLQP